MNIAIINYGAGNVKSVQFALKRLGFDSEVTNNASKIKNADRVIFPGVGEASSAMKMIKKFGLDELIPTLQQPVLGICLGMQLLCNFSEEGNTKGLEIFNCDVTKFNTALKVPQIGWNQITNLQTDLFKEITENEYMYLVHSYYAPLCEHTIATTKYHFNYSTGLQNNNFFGVQFHPEKSSKAGAKVLYNFLNLKL